MGRSARFGRKGRPGAPAAAGAGVDKASMLDDLEQPLRQIEHLTPLNACRHRRTQGATAMPASRGRMRHDPVGLGDLAKGFAVCPFCPPLGRPMAREGSPASSSGHRSTAASNSANRPDPAAGEGQHSQPAEIPAPAEAMQSEPSPPEEEASFTKNHDFLAEAPH